jgi:hypothetical protein
LKLSEMPARRSSRKHIMPRSVRSPFPIRYHVMSSLVGLTSVACIQHACGSGFLHASCLHVCIVCTYPSMYVYMRVSVCKFECICGCFACVHMCAYECMHECVHVISITCLHTYICKQTHAHMYVYAYAICARIPAHERTYACCIIFLECNVSSLEDVRTPWFCGEWIDDEGCLQRAFMQDAET